MGALVGPQVGVSVHNNTSTGFVGFLWPPSAGEFMIILLGIKVGGKSAVRQTNTSYLLYQIGSYYNIQVRVNLLLGMQQNEPLLRVSLAAMRAASSFFFVECLHTTQVKVNWPPGHCWVDAVAANLCNLELGAGVLQNAHLPTFSTLFG